MAASSAMEISGAFLKVNLAIVFGFCSFMPCHAPACPAVFVLLYLKIFKDFYSILEKGNLVIQK